MQTPVSVGVLRETVPGERRVALTPDGVKRLRALGVATLVESGAGQTAWFPDDEYAAAGATVTTAEQVRADADILIGVQAPATAAGLRVGQVLVGLLQPLTSPALVKQLAQAKVTAVSLDLLPRTLSRAQSMDALTSQANVAGYKAALLAADAYAGYFPMLITAAGTTRPARVLVVGAGVAGLQAIATARRLGALVTGYDVREAAHADITSTGASLLELGAATASAAGGYARALTGLEAGAQQQALAAAVAQFDVIITTAQVPGRRPPLLITAAAVAALRPGSVIVDLAAGGFGGNVEGSAPGATVVTGGGVTIIGAANLPAAVPRAASVAYSRNVAALLGHFVHDGAFAIPADDEIAAAVVITHDGDIVQSSVRAAVAAAGPEPEEGAP